MHWIVIAAIGAGVGFLGGLFGKGGSAVATPLLAAAGVPAIVALASPLPATIPGTLVAYRRYRHLGITDPAVVRTTALAGVPATVIGSLTTPWIGGPFLVAATDVLIAAIGATLLIHPTRIESVPPDVSHRTARIVGIGIVVGFVAGALANAGGFLLVPLYLAVLRTPFKTALGCSLATAAALAVPGTVVHALLGHVDVRVTLVFAAASIPLSSLGARVALRTDTHRLERLFGAGLVTLGIGLLIVR